MGFYINQINGKDVPRFEKASFIIQNVAGARLIEPPTEWQEGLVCVVDNGNFEAAAYAFNEHEMKVFLATDSDYDQRPRTWLLVPGAKEIVGYKR